MSHLNRTKLITFFKLMKGFEFHKSTYASFIGRKSKLAGKTINDILINMKKFGFINLYYPKKNRQHRITYYTLTANGRKFKHAIDIIEELIGSEENV